MLRLVLRYTRHDREIAGSVARALADLGHSTVMAISEPEGAAGPASEGLTVQCDAVILFWSDHAATSPFVRQEIERALDAWIDNKLVLVVLDGTPPPPGLRDIPPVRLEDESGAGLNGERAAHDIVGRLRELSKPPVAVRGPGEWSAPASHNLHGVAVLPLLAVGGGAGLAGWLFGKKDWEWRDLWDVPGRLKDKALEVSTLQYWIDRPIELAMILLVLVALIAPPVFKRLRSQRSRMAASSQADIATGHDMFVSFSTSDLPTVSAVAAVIKRAGYEPWLYHEHAVSQDRRYPVPIVKAIKSSRKVALMCSRASYGSDDVIREIHVAGRSKKPIVAFFLDSDDFPGDIPEEFEYFISGFPWIFVRRLGNKALVEEIKRAMKT